MSFELREALLVYRSSERRSTSTRSSAFVTRHSVRLDQSGTLAEQAREWKIAVEQAESVARLAGKLPAGVTRSLEQSGAAGVDWRELLRRAWSDTIPSDYSWIRPNRRHVWSGVFLPGIISEGAGEIVIAVDCSGSVSRRQLGLFQAEIRSILEAQRPNLVHVPSGTSAANLPGRDVPWRQKLVPECRQFTSTVISRAAKAFS